MMPTMLDQLNTEKRIYLSKKKSCKAFYKFWGEIGVKPLNTQGGLSAGDYCWIDDKQYVVTGYDLHNYRIMLKPIIIGPILYKHF